LGLLFGVKNPILQEFGFPVAVRKPRTGPTNVAAAQKAEATRKARGTLGSKQRLAIHGVVAPAASGSATSSAPAGNANVNGSAGATNSSSSPSGNGAPTH
jgi:hypothetical protein